MRMFASLHRVTHRGSTLGILDIIDPGRFGLAVFRNIDLPTLAGVIHMVGGKELLAVYYSHYS